MNYEAFMKSRREGLGDKLVGVAMREGDQHEYEVVKYNRNTEEKVKLTNVIGKSAASAKALHFDMLLIPKKKKQDGPITLNVT